MNMGKNYKAIVWAMFACGLVAHAEPSGDAGHFPADTFPDTRGQRYSEVLEMLGEPSISAAINTVDAYRFSYIHAFDDALAVRVQGDGESSYTLYGTVYTADSSITNELKRTTKILEPEEVGEVKRLLRKCRFWKKPVDWRYTWKMKLLRKIRIVPQAQLDGSSWLMEANEDGFYHVVDEWVGGRDEDYVALCEYFVEISGLKPSEPEKHSYFRKMARKQKEK